MVSTYAYSVEQQWEESRGRLFCALLESISIEQQRCSFVESFPYVLKDFRYLRVGCAYVIYEQLFAIKINDGRTAIELQAEKLKIISLKFENF